MDVGGLGYFAYFNATFCSKDSDDTTLVGGPLELASSFVYCESESQIYSSTEIDISPPRDGPKRPHGARRGLPVHLAN